MAKKKVKEDDLEVVEIRYRDVPIGELPQLKNWHIGSADEIFTCYLNVVTYNGDEQIKIRAIYDVSFWFENYINDLKKFKYLSEVRIDKVTDLSNWDKIIEVERKFEPEMKRNDLIKVSQTVCEFEKKFGSEEKIRLKPLSNFLNNFWSEFNFWNVVLEWQLPEIQRLSPGAMPDFNYNWKNIHRFATNQLDKEKSISYLNNLLKSLQNKAYNSSQNTLQDVTDLSVKMNRLIDNIQNDRIFFEDFYEENTNQEMEYIEPNDLKPTIKQIAYSICYVLNELSFDMIDGKPAEINQAIEILFKNDKTSIKNAVANIRCFMYDGLVKKHFPKQFEERKKSVNKKDLVVIREKFLNIIESIDVDLRKFDDEY